MTRITDNKDVIFRKSFRFVTGKGLDMMKMSIGNMPASWTFFPKITSAHFTNISTSDKNTSSEAVVSVGSSDRFCIKRNPAFPIRMFISENISCPHGNRHFFSMLDREFTSYKVFASASGGYIKSAKTPKNESTARIYNASDFFHCFVILYIFLEQKVFRYISSFRMTAGIFWPSLLYAKHTTEPIDCPGSASEMFCNFTNRPLLGNV